MKKRLLASVLPLLLLLCVFPAPAAVAATEPGRMEIENHAYADGVFSCDVKLSGADAEGYVFAALFEQSGKMRKIAQYPAQDTVQVRLTDTVSTDYVRIFRTDGAYTPIAEPEIRRMRDSDAQAYADFETALERELRLDGPSASDGSNRLLVSCAEALDWNALEGLDAAIPGPNQHYVLQFANPTQAKRAKEQLEAMPSVRYVEFDESVSFEKETNEEDTARQLSGESPHSWGVERSGIDQYVAELQEKGIRREIIVAVVDSGVEMSHPFLADFLLEGHSAILKNPSVQDEYGHGTHVSGIIADCVRGMNVKILPVRVLDKYGSSNPMTIANGIYYAANHGAHVINLSLGYPEHKQWIEDAIEYALSKNITVVVAACNSNADAKGFCPAHMEDCITVTALERNGTQLRRWGKSNYGALADIAAAGGAVESSMPGHNYEEKSGTSMAAPHVSAAAALLVCERGSTQTPSQICDALKAAAETLTPDKPVGAGFLNMRPFTAPKNVSIRFDANGGMGIMEPLTAPSGTLVTLPANQFLMDGATFTRWDTTPDGSGTPYAEGALLKAEHDLTLYAQWTEPPEIGAYALLYSDGELIFQNHSGADPDRTLVKTYPIPLAETPAQHTQWYDERASIRTAVFADSIRPYSTATWFYNCGNLTEIRGLENLDTSLVTDMSQMFSGCGALTSLNLSALDTSNVVDMRQMFFACPNLSTLDLTGWNTANVTNMEDLFNGCSALETVFVSETFTTDSVSQSAEMFGGCTSLIGGAGTKCDGAHIDKEYARVDGGLSNPGYFTDKNASIPSDDIYAILYGDGELVFQNHNRTDSGRSVTGVYAVKGEDYLPPWNSQSNNITTVTFADKIQPMSTANWFSDCANLTNIWNIRNLDTSNVTDMSFMFDGCGSLTSLDVGGFDTSHVIYMSYMFSNCSGFTSLDVSGFDTSHVTVMRGMFYKCGGLSSLDLSGFDTRKVTCFGTDWESGYAVGNPMFGDCANLNTIYVSENFVTSLAPDGEDLFGGCTSLVGGAGTKYDGAHIDKEYARIDGGLSNPGYFTDRNAPSPSEDVYAILYDGGELVFQVGNIPESGKSVTKTYEVELDKVYEHDTFPWETERASIRVVNFADKINPTSTANWFYDCPGLTRVENIVNLDTSNVVNMNRMFCNCGSLSELDVTGFDTSQVVDMGSLFFSCGNLRELDVSGWNVANVADMGGMFAGCRSLTALDVSGWNVASLENASFMFADCAGLTELDLSGWNTAALTDTQNMFYESGNLKTIYASEKFSVELLKNGFNMFDGCVSLVGGAGTKYDGERKNHDYARVDGGADAPGYFTAKDKADLL